MRHWRQLPTRRYQPMLPDDIDPNAPDWWYGDEDASQSFLQAMGVSLE